MAAHDHLLALQLRVLGFKSHTSQIMGCQLRYYQKRHSESRGAVLFLHGVGASSGHFGSVMTQVNRMGYDVYAVDLPGHGLSSDPNADLTSDEFFGIFEKWVLDILPARCALVGNSLGGAMSLRYGLQHFDRVSKLILISPAGGFTDEEEWNEFKKTIAFESLQDSMKFVPKIYHRAPWYLPLTYRPCFKAMRRKSVLRLIQQTQFKDFDLDKNLYSTLPPTWLIWGKSEKLLPNHHLLHFKELLPSQVVFEEPEGVGHCPQLDNPRWLIQRIGEILQD